MTETRISDRHFTAERSPVPIYRDGETNYCPGCGRSHWLIGLRTAECAFCSTALALVESSNTHTAPTIFKRGAGGGHVR